MLAVWITFVHFSVSVAMSLPNSVGEPIRTAAPSSPILVMIAWSARAALISRLSVPIISELVFLGAQTPCQFVESNPGTKWESGGMSGRAGHCSLDADHVQRMEAALDIAWSTMVAADKSISGGMLAAAAREML